MATRRTTRKAPAAPRKRKPAPKRTIKVNVTYSLTQKEYAEILEESLSELNSYRFNSVPKTVKVEGAGS